MADTKSPADSENARKRAQNFFAASEQRDNVVRQMIADERTATDAKTAKLRALRLAKEEADRVAEAHNPKPAPKTRARKSRAKA
jgi:hypothetical protein